MIKDNTIYRLAKTTQCSDHECWGHWTEEHVVSLHASKEGAEAKIKTLILKDLEKIAYDREESTKSQANKIHFDKKERLRKDNTKEFQTGNDGHPDEYHIEDLYVIREVKIED
jgi:urate oxidase